MMLIITSFFLPTTDISAESDELTKYSMYGCNLESDQFRLIPFDDESVHNISSSRPTMSYGILFQFSSVKINT